jgi:hypothetical protein
VDGFGVAFVDEDGWELDDCGAVVGVILDAMRQYESKLSIPEGVLDTELREEGRRTLSNPIP